jgi:hypothetical protein
MNPFETKRVGKAGFFPRKYPCPAAALKRKILLPTPEYGRLKTS